MSCEFCLLLYFCAVSDAFLVSSGCDYSIKAKAGVDTTTIPLNITVPTCPGTCCCRKAASPVPHLHGPSLAAIPESRQRAQTGIICSAVCW